jgi:hypothetical protein
LAKSPLNLGQAPTSQLVDELPKDLLLEIPAPKNHLGNSAAGISGFKLVGWTILLKAVLQSIPIYQALKDGSAKNLLRKDGGNIQEVLMGRSSKIKKWALVSWPNLTKHKMDGGLGLRDPYILNQVMGAKLWWHWMGGRLISGNKYGLQIQHAF